MLEGIQGGGISTPSNNKQRSKSPGAACPSVIKSLDTSWHQVDVSKLISDLDEDIRNSEMEKTSGGGGSDQNNPRTPISSRPSIPPHSSSGTPRPGSNQTAGSRTPGTPATGRQQTGSPVSSRMPVSSSSNSSSAGPRILASSLPGGGGKVSSGMSALNAAGDDSGLKMKIKRTKSGRQEIVKSDSGGSINSGGSGSGKSSSSSSKSINGDGHSVAPTSDNNKNSENKSSSAATGGSTAANGPLAAMAAYNNSSSSSSSGPVSTSSSASGDSGPPSSASGESSPRSPHAGSPAAGGKSVDFNMAVTETMNGISSCNNKLAAQPPIFSSSGSAATSMGFTTTDSGAGGGFKQSHTSFNPLSSDSIQMLTSKKLKVDVGTVTDASTVTEPEILGPCEPGTPVNLDGIVWHETDTGVLVVNVTWRGKTYVGTLLDCARHTNQWSAPRFTDSPEPGGKGRGKRCRNSATPQELEPRKNLRSSKGKGKGGKGNKGGAIKAEQQPVEDEFNFPAPASPKDAGNGKRKKEAETEDSKKRKRNNSDSDESSPAVSGGNEIVSKPPSDETESADTETEDIKPPLPIKREPKQVVYSYTMMECPRKDCNKQYKAEDGLRWHVSHSHPEFIGADGQIRDSADVEREEQERKEEQGRRRAARLEKEERKKKEAMRLENEKGSGTPAKQPKLDDTPKSQPAATTVQEAGKNKPSFPTTSQPGLTPANGNIPGPAAPLPGSGTINLPGIAAQPWANPEVQPLNNETRLYEDNLKKMKATIDSLSAVSVPMAGAGVSSSATTPSGAVTTTTSSIPGVAMSLSSTPRGPGHSSMEKSKVPATSPAAFSDISDDGEDSRGVSVVKDLKLNTSLDHIPGGLSGGPPGLPGTPQQRGSVQVYPQHGPHAAVVSHHQSMPSRNSSPLARQHHPSSLAPHHPPAPQHHQPPPPQLSHHTTPSSSSSSSSPTVLPRSSISLPGSGMPGPELGSPEYHKYLAANGFPPFPYPYPVGMDPNYHIQLLKTDPIYKAKWEKDRAERERAFKEQLDKDQGRFSGLSLVKEERLQGSGGGANNAPSQQRKPQHPPQDSRQQPEDLRKREPSGDSRPTSRASPMISVKPEFREKEDLKKEVKNEDQGVKPTMETRGPPPGPQTFGYMHPSLIRPPYTFGSIPPPFDPMFVNSGMSPYGLHPGLPGMPSPYALNPGLLGAAGRPPIPFSSFGGGAGDPLLRAPFPMGTAEDLARAAAGGPPSLSGTKALDLLQHHASQYYANQKLAELQERALKSPISSLPMPLSRSGSPSVSKPITTLAGMGKDSLHTTTAGSVGGKSPPPLRHVHTHTHTHIGLGYPFPGGLPNVPPVGSLPPGALPPPPVGVGSSPFPSPNASYQGKSPT